MCTTFRFQHMGSRLMSTSRFDPLQASIVRRSSQERKSHNGENRSLNLPIQGMSCASRVPRVEGTRKQLTDIGEVVVSLGTNNAKVILDPAQARLAEMIRAIDKAASRLPRQKSRSPFMAGPVLRAWTKSTVP